MSQSLPILYAEDDANDAFFTERAFQIAQIPNPLLIVDTGKEAIDYLSGEGKYASREEHPLPCLVLLDLKLPLKSGFEVLSWIRAEHATTIPVLILTSSNQTDDMSKAYSAGANAFLVKPGTPTGLVTIVTGIKRFWLNLTEEAPG